MIIILFYLHLFNVAYNIFMNEEIVDSVVKSKKYSRLDEGYIEYIVGILSRKYKKSEDLDFAVRNLLHRVWGAYYKTLPDFDKLLRKIVSLDGETKKEYIASLTRIHSSTKERLGDFKNMYKWIVEICKPRTVVDIGCGLNPLMISELNSFRNLDYWFYDIDKEEITFLNSVFRTLGIENFIGRVGNIFTTSFPKADVVFLFKILPLIEQIKEGCSKEIIEKIKSRYIIVTYPIRSLGGKNKGMEKRYSNISEELFEKGTVVGEKIFNNEMAYIVFKKDNHLN